MSHIDGQKTTKLVLGHSKGWQRILQREVWRVQLTTMKRASICVNETIRNKKIDDEGN
jgi:hypothetical protein